MEYDEIDQYVDQLFRDTEDRGGDGEPPINGEVLSGDWRIDRIDQIIQDVYDEAIWWHNKRIETEGNPEGNPSGLRGIKNKLPELPDPGGYDASIYRNGYPQAAAAMPQTRRGGLTWAERLLIIVVVIGLLIFMAATL